MVTLVTQLTIDFFARSGRYVCYNFIDFFYSIEHIRDFFVIAIAFFVYFLQILSIISFRTFVYNESIRDFLIYSLVLL